MTTQDPICESAKRLCWLCGNLVDDTEHLCCRRSHENLNRAIRILENQVRNPIPSVLAIRDAIGFLRQV